MVDDKDPPKKKLDDALGSLSKGVGKVFKAASDAGREIKTEFERGGVVKTFEEGGREIARAAGSVGKQVGAELLSWGERLSGTPNRTPSDTDKSDKAPTETEPAAARVDY